MIHPQEYEGWTGRISNIPGVESRLYSHPQYKDWEIYVNDPHGFAATYRAGTKIQNYDGLPEAVAAMKDVAPDFPPSTIDLGSMTWTCNVCGDTRPDALIGVAKRPGPIPEALWNIRFCIDRRACVEFAQRPGEWAGPADRYRVDVPVTGVDIEDLDQVERIVQQIPYETMWTSVSGTTRAVVLLADASLEEAISHATATLLAASRIVGSRLALDLEHIEAQETRR